MFQWHVLVCPSGYNTLQKVMDECSQIFRIGPNLVRDQLIILWGSSGSLSGARIVLNVF